MFTSKKILAVWVIALFVIGLSGCSENATSPTMPQQLLSGVKATSGGHAVEISLFSASALANLYTGEGFSDIGPAAGALNLNDEGLGTDELGVNIWEAGDYMIGYRLVNGPSYFLFFRAMSPIVVHIGLHPGDAVDRIVIYHSFTYDTADAALLDKKVGDAYFYEDYGILSSDEAEAIDYYASEAQAEILYAPGATMK